jgi:hypothetical protein
MSSRGSRKSGKPGKQQSSPDCKKEVPSSPVASSSILSNSSDSPNSNEPTLSFPLVKICDNAKILPRYTTGISTPKSQLSSCFTRLFARFAVLARNDKEGVTMEDTLQLELEVLLSAAAVRIRALKGEVGALEHADDKKDKKSRVAKTVCFF